MPEHQRSLFSLLDIPQSPRLDPLAQDLFQALLRGVDLITDARIREIKLERTNPSGSWTIVSAHAFVDLEGKSAPYKPLSHPPRHVGNSTLTDGSREHRRRDQG